MVRLAQERDIVVLMIGVRMPPNFGASYNNRFQQVFENVVNEYDIHYLDASSNPKWMGGGVIRVYDTKTGAGV